MSGWISKRHMRRGGSLYEGGPKRKGPLRKIVQIIRPQSSIFDAAHVRLECGHEGKSWGGVRAVCVECGQREARKP